MSNWYTSKLRILGRHSKKHYLRFYPNPGFMFTIFGRRIKWSKFYGWKKEAA